MALLDVTGGALLTRLWKSGGLTPVALGLLGFLGYRAYQKRERLVDMAGGALVGIGKLPAMLLAQMELSPPKRVRKTRTRRRTAVSARGRRRTTPRHAAAPQTTVH